MFRYYNFIFLLLFVAVVINGQNRKMTYSLNPGCLKICDNNTVLVHVAADGINDTLHHIWDFTSKPTVFLALTPLNTELIIDWENFLWNGEKGAVKFSKDIIYAFSIVFDKIIEYNDVNKTAQYNPTNNSENYVTFLNTEFYNWTVERKHVTDNVIAFVLKSSEYKFGNITKTGSVKITLNAFGNSEHSSLQPHLLHTTNATQIDVILDKLQVKYGKSRYSLGLLIASTDQKHSNLTQIKRKSLDDEHSPGIFTLGEVLTPVNVSSDKGGYLQWRTVAYTSSGRLMTNSTNVIETRARHVEFPVERLNLTVVGSYFGEELNLLPVHEMFVSFGAEEDGFYSKTGYLSWTVLAGLGRPAEEGFSLLVLLILAIGLGLPALLIIVGTICIVTRRVARKRDAIFITNY
uniref:Putative lysosomal transcription factor n=1 Tax=Panstrongylus lignarius TaxID=156445 RepID=A0A224XHJ0_9HEMI